MNKYKVGIVLTCYKRPQYLRRTLDTLKHTDFPPKCKLVIIEDNGKDFGVINQINNFVLNIPVKRIFNNKNLGVRYSLLKGFRELEKDCNIFTNIDSDVLLKPNWLKEILYLHEYTKDSASKGMFGIFSRVIVSGFNCHDSCSHKYKDNYNRFVLKNHVGGINMLFDLDTYNNIYVPVLEKGDGNYGWDWEICDHAIKNNTIFVVSTPSVIQHIGTHGLNSDARKVLDISEDFNTSPNYPTVHTESSSTGLINDKEILNETFIILGIKGRYFISLENNYKKYPYVYINIDYSNFDSIFKDNKSSASTLLVKTNDAYNIITEHIKKNEIKDCKVVNTGFTSIDMKINVPNRQKTFLHTAGKSPNKNTKLLLQVWLKHPEWPLLTILCRDYCVTQFSKNRMVKGTHNIRIISEKIPYGLLRKLMNENIYHICPSKYEGFGHYINEARSVGAVVLYSNVPPMNEFFSGNDGVPIHCSRIKANNRGVEFYEADIQPQDIEHSVVYAMKLSDAKINKIGESTRKKYLSDKALFHNKLSSVFETEQDFGLISFPFRNEHKKCTNTASVSICPIIRPPTGTPLKIYERGGICSQWSQDTIIIQILNNIGVKNKFFVEAGSRRPECLNSAFLRLKCGWKGLLLDGAPGKSTNGGCPDCPGQELFDVGEDAPVRLRKEFLRMDNINDIFTRHNVPHEFDVLTLDIDGNDYWVLLALDTSIFSPRIIVVEFSSFFSRGQSYVISYDPKFVWNGTEITGASLSALDFMLSQKGYKYVYQTSGEHAFFVRKDLLADEDLNIQVPEQVKEGWQYIERLRRLKNIPKKNLIDTLNNEKWELVNTKQPSTIRISMILLIVLGCLVLISGIVLVIVYYIRKR